MIGGVNASGYIYANYRNYGDLKVPPVKRVNPEQDRIKEMTRTGKADCETCKSRKYIDGSNDNNVSFKTPGHISPEASKATVSSHEAEHVANAKNEASKPGAELISASVTLRTATCPECGTSYVSGGTTTTQIKYANETNPYEQSRKSMEALFLKGMNVDIAA